MTAPARCVYVAVSGFQSKKILGVYATPEGAVAAHDGLWLEAGAPDDEGRRSWVNQRACSWGSGPDDPIRIVEVEVK